MLAIRNLANRDNDVCMLFIKSELFEVGLGSFSIKYNITVALITFKMRDQETK